MNRNQLLDWCKNSSNHHTLRYEFLICRRITGYIDYILFQPENLRARNVFFKELIKYLWKKIFNNEIESNDEIVHEGVNLLYYLFTDCCYTSSNFDICGVNGNTSAIDNVEIYERGMLDYLKTSLMCSTVDCNVGKGINIRFTNCINCSVSRFSLSSPKSTEMIDFHSVKRCMGKLDNCCNCVDCINCYNCNNCTLCTWCTDVHNSILCEKCTECNWCNNCEDCSNCSMCDNCIKCKLSRGLDTCKYCRDNCSNCTGCIKCKKCKNCDTCVSCNKCDGIQLCINCKECKDNCCECTDCINCVKCVHCINSTACTNCINCTKCRTCTDCTECSTCIKQTSKKQFDSVMYSRINQHISEEMLVFKQPFVVDLDNDGQRVEINGRIIQYFDEENQLVFQGTCQYEYPINNWSNALNFKLGQGWIYYPELQTRCCYIILSTNSKYNVTLADLINIHDTDTLIEYIQKQSKRSKNSVVFVYDRRGNEVYKHVN